MFDETLITGGAAPSGAMDEPDDGNMNGDAPFMLPDLDEDIVQDFAAVGIDVTRPAELLAAMGKAQRHTTASMFLRLAGECTARIKDLERARDDQIAIISAHYGRQIVAEERRRDSFNGYVEEIARRAVEAGDFGRKKSASTPFGDFGVRDSSETVAMVDEGALLAHLSAVAPEFVTVRTSLPLSEARERFTDEELKDAKQAPLWNLVKSELLGDRAGTLPPGVAIVEAVRKPFAKPDANIVSGSAGSLPHLSRAASAKEAA